MTEHSGGHSAEPQEPHNPERTEPSIVVRYSEAILEALSESRELANGKLMELAPWQDQETYTKYFLTKENMFVPVLGGMPYYMLYVEPFMNNPPTHGYTYQPSKNGYTLKFDVSEAGVWQQQPRKIQPSNADNERMMIAHLQTAPVTAVRPNLAIPLPPDPELLAFNFQCAASHESVERLISNYTRTTNPVHRMLLQESIITRMLALDPQLSAEYIAARIDDR